MFFRKDYTIEDLKKEENIIYFDIDGTLGSGDAHRGYKKDESYRNKKKEELEELKKRIGIKFFSFPDFISPDKYCLELFQKFLKEHNAKAFCISSWAVSLKLRSNNALHKKEINPVDLLNEVFKSTYKDWDFNNVVGGKHFSNRGQEVKEFIEKYELKSNAAILDDSAGRGYPENELTISVDGRKGFTEKEYKLMKKIMFGN